MGSKQTYTEHGETWSDDEVEQIVRIVSGWGTECNGKPVDRRHYSARVLRWAERNLFIEWRKSRHADGYYKVETELSARDVRYARPYFTASWQAYVVDDVPAEALWRMLRPIFADLDGTVLGRSQVTRWAGWTKFGLDPVTVKWLAESPGATQRETDRMAAILARLAMQGYCTFLASGNIWELRKEGPSWLR